MEFPIKVFEIKNGNNYSLKLEIAEVYGYPKETSFRGGYDIRCNLYISVGVFKVQTDNYYSSTGTLYNFYNQLNECYTKLNGKAVYEVYCNENDLSFSVCFEDGNVTVAGNYRDDPMGNNILTFEFNLDQSYFPEVLRDLKTVVGMFGDNKGVIDL